MSARDRWHRPRPGAEFSGDRPPAAVTSGTAMCAHGSPLGRFLMSATQLDRTIWSTAANSRRALGHCSGPVIVCVALASLLR